ncbi:hypothetical protein [Roseivirga sp. E12]|uniref:hypothetical protein n=1 Tax=Roseivirga sp. E12 TaxID=2819237 RepID=UPI001ABD10AD|nr:hypothetical protein [Roseivirga sp. E12]MBO3697676.1 hypothetical protein [Roseivirga sp. E12]
MSILKTSILLRTSVIIALLFSSALTIKAQSNLKTYSYKKGQVLDIILLNTKPEAQEELAYYFKTALPVATKYGYKGQGGLALKSSPSQGNYHPESLIFGVWNSLKQRKDFLTNIEDVMPEFHQARRNIWSSFNMTFWEMKSDLSFTVDTDKFNVATAYWKSDEGDFGKFKKSWDALAKRTGGKEILALTNGESPFGYYYNPDYMVITQWNSKSDFEKFLKENLEMKHDGVKHVNQFIIQ